MAKTKLVRIAEQTYRTERGEVLVWRFPFGGPTSEARDDARRNPWLVQWTDMFSVKHNRRFPTLAAARAALDSKTL